MGPDGVGTWPPLSPKIRDFRGPREGGDLVSAEDIAGIDFIDNILEASIETIGDDGLGAGLEVLQVIHHLTTEEEIVLS